MSQCTMCSKEVNAKQLEADGVCNECHARHHLPYPTEPIRPRVPCVRCKGTSFVRCLAIRERAASGGDIAVEYIAQLAATYAIDSSTTFWAGRTVETPDPGRPLGPFEAYICRTCGYTELYARRPSDIPIGPQYATEEFDVSGDGPYR